MTLEIFILARGCRPTYQSRSPNNAVLVKKTKFVFKRLLEVSIIFMYVSGLCEYTR